MTTSLPRVCHENTAVFLQTDQPSLSEATANLRLWFGPSAHQSPGAWIWRGDTVDTPSSGFIYIYQDYIYIWWSTTPKRTYVMHEIHHISGFCRLLKLDTLHRYLEMFHGKLLPLYVLFEVFGEVYVLSLKSFSCWCLFSIREACFYVCLVVHGALNLD